MKHVVVFFLLICFKLITGYGCAHASANEHIIAVSSNNNEARTQLERTVSKHDYILAENVDISEDSFSEIGVEVEDESEDIIKKHSSLVRYSLAFNYAFIGDEQDPLIADRLQFCNYLSYTGSCKYIVQRALRI